MKYDTLTDAVQAFADSFSVIPQAVISRDENWTSHFYEVTPITKGDSVYISSKGAEGTVVDVEGDIVTVEPYKSSDGDELVVHADDVTVNHDGEFPMWNYLWAPRDSADESWVRRHLTETAECGFRIYEDTDMGVVLGIDGAGYDFIKAHWQPLYEKMGLQWHSNA